MTDLPIIFSGPMVRALLEGRKTMTRRLAWRGVMPGLYEASATGGLLKPIERPSPWQRVKPGDRLWVREAWCAHSTFNDLAPRDIPRSRIFYAADSAYSPSGGRLRPSIHMPRWASRLTLTVTATKLERLQDISEADARAEGVLWVPGHGEIAPEELRVDPGYSAYLNCRQGFEVLWNSLHGPNAWYLNPEVVALTFTVEKRNIDATP